MTALWIAYGAVAYLLVALLFAYACDHTFVGEWIPWSEDRAEYYWRGFVSLWWPGWLCIAAVLLAFAPFAGLAWLVGWALDQ